MIGWDRNEGSGTDDRAIQFLCDVFCANGPVARAKITISRFPKYFSIASEWNLFH